MKIYNSLTRKVEEFKPQSPLSVGMYTCGMTVYDYAHIGHGRKYVNDDILKRILECNGYKVKHVQNVTDVGHLVSDADEGEDKLEKGAKKTGKTVWEVAQFYTDHFYESMDLLNIIRPDVICKATQHIPEQIELVKKLIKKGFAYDTEEAVYYNVLKFPNYGKAFGGQNLADKKTAVREEVEKGLHKKNPADFALWFKRVGRFSDHVMHWNSPWGDGFPGWHIECSAMSMEYLGESFDLHTGGIDHIAVHHPNEIAQSEAATGVKFVNYWMHFNFLSVEGQKMSKSLGNIFKVTDIINKGYDPLSLRYLYLQTHYRQEMNFTWDALDAAQIALSKLRNNYLNLEIGDLSKEFLSKFNDACNDDLNMSKALALMWENIGKLNKATLNEVDKVLGFNLSKHKKEKINIPDVVQKLLKQRERLRNEKKYEESDRIREEIVKMGYKVEDKS